MQINTHLSTAIYASLLSMAACVTTTSCSNETDLATPQTVAANEIKLILSEETFGDERAARASFLPANETAETLDKQSVNCIHTDQSAMLSITDETAEVTGETSSRVDGDPLTTVRSGMYTILAFDDNGNLIDYIKFLKNTFGITFMDFPQGTTGKGDNNLLTTNVKNFVCVNDPIPNSDTDGISVDYNTGVVTFDITKAKDDLFISDVYQTTTFAQDKILKFVFRRQNVALNIQAKTYDPGLEVAIDWESGQQLATKTVFNFAAHTNETLAENIMTTAETINGQSGSNVALMGRYRNYSTDVDLSSKTPFCAEDTIKFLRHNGLNLKNFRLKYKQAKLNGRTWFDEHVVDLSQNDIQMKPNHLYKVAITLSLSNVLEEGIEPTEEQVYPKSEFYQWGAMSPFVNGSTEYGVGKEGYWPGDPADMPECPTSRCPTEAEAKKYFGGKVYFDPDGIQLHFLNKAKSGESFWVRDASHKAEQITKINLRGIWLPKWEAGGAKDNPPLTAGFSRTPFTQPFDPSVRTDGKHFFLPAVGCYLFNDGQYYNVGVADIANGGTGLYRMKDSPGRIVFRHDPNDMSASPEGFGIEAGMAGFTRMGYVCMPFQ